MRSAPFSGQYRARMDTPLGRMTATGDGIALTGLWFDGQAHFPDLRGTIPDAEQPVFRRTAEWLAAYFAGARPDVEVPLAPAGTAFRQAVWAILRTVPYGATVTYGAIAAQLAASGTARGYAQAVGGAVGHNPISLLIPCHRVVGANGALTGYAGGLARKAQLLALESGEK